MLMPIVTHTVSHLLDSGVACTPFLYYKRFPSFCYVHITLIQTINRTSWYFFFLLKQNNIYLFKLIYTSSDTNTNSTSLKMSVSFCTCGKYIVSPCHDNDNEELLGLMEMSLTLSQWVKCCYFSSICRIIGLNYPWETYRIRAT